MRFKIVFQEFVVEKISKGKNFYEKGICTYTFNGENRKQTLMSFSNPTVFAALKKASQGQELTVESGKNDQGYNQWNSIETEETPQQNKAPAASTTTPVRSTYETPEERAARQVLIVRQSSLSAAVDSLVPGSKGALDSKTVLERAQEYVDWVFQKESIADMHEDIPY